MKFTFIADIHLSHYGQDKIEDTTNLPQRLHSLQEVLHEIAKYTVDKNINKMIIGGDILHGKSVIHAIAQDIMLDFFEEWSKTIDFFIIDGNHDLSGKGSNVVSALKSLRNIDNLRWIPFNETMSIDNDRVLLIPYGPNMTEKILNNQSKILISHFGLNEGVLNSGISIVSDISIKNLIGKYELVLLGHYHKPQEIIRDDIKLYYVGSPIQLDWGEKNDEKRFLVVDTETLEVKSIPTKGYRKHIELNITNSNKSKILKIAKEEKEKGNFVKILKREIVDLDTNDDFMIIDKVERDVTNRGITSSMSQRDKFQKFLEIKEVPQQDHENYIKKALELVERCEK